jgi:hypothetical protein
MEAKPATAALTVGFLFVIYGAEYKDQCNLAVNCLRATFGGHVGVTVVKVVPEDLACKVDRADMFGSCWGKLMLIKVLSAMLAPEYDIVVLADSDVYANPTYPLREYVLDRLRSIFEQRTVDIATTDDLLYHQRVRARNNGNQGGLVNMTRAEFLGYANAGFLVFRRSAAMTRFFACASELVPLVKISEQDAYNRLFESPTMRSVVRKTLPPVWSCRSRVSVNSGWKQSFTRTDVAEYPCLFVHSKRATPSAGPVCHAGATAAAKALPPTEPAEPLLRTSTSERSAERQTFEWPTFEAALDSWAVARQALDPDPQQKDPWASRLWASEPSGRASEPSPAPWLGSETTYGLYRLPPSSRVVQKERRLVDIARHLSCRANVDGQELQYLIVYKSNSMGLCGNVLRLPGLGLASPAGASGRKNALAVSFVREPLGRFISGYGEFVARLEGNLRPGHGGQVLARCLANISFISFRGTDVEVSPSGFVRAYLSGELLGARPPGNDATCNGMLGQLFWGISYDTVPQLSFFAAALLSRDARQRVGRFDFIGKLEQVEADWLQVGRLMRQGAWPAFNTTLFGDPGGRLWYGDRHDIGATPKSLAARREMAELLSRDGPELVAVCAVLLLDFVCFSYPLPKHCTEALGGSAREHRCPFSVPHEEATAAVAGG